MRYPVVVRKTVTLALIALAFTARAQIAGPRDALPQKLREAMARVDAQRYNVVPRPSADGSGLTGFDRLQRDYPGQRSVQVDRRLSIPLIIQGTGIPWIPGSGNQLPQRAAIRPDDLAAIATGFTAQYSDLLGITPADLVVNRRTLVHFGKNNRYWSVHLNQVVRDAESEIVPVREAQVFFRVSHGNVIQFGNYLAIPPRSLSLSGIIGRADAVQKALALVEDFAHVKVTDAAMDLGQTDHSLEVVLVNAPDGTLGHQLVRAFILTGESYDVEVWLDAHSGEVANIIDRTETIAGTVRGGIYPNSNNAGTEDLRALPFINVVNNGVTKAADASGVYDYAPAGSLATASLSGPYITINDFCGASSLSTSLPPGDMTFSGGAGTDCTTPGVGGPGNTHAARTAFYHLNLIKEKARQYLDPAGTPWLNQALTTNVNKPQPCNAGWSPGSMVLNFYTTTVGGPGGYDCANTGEIAAVFLHEFGHGLDQMTNGSAPDGATKEAYGDTMAFLQTHDSCIGPGFSPGHVCQDGCTTCTGVRDVNLPVKVKPSNITSSPINCLSDFIWFDGSIIPRTCPSGGVMGFDVHCESEIAAGAVWDMAQAFVAKYGDGAGWALADRIWYESVYDTGSAYQIVSGGQCNTAANIDGCGPLNWYTVMLAVDDDNGNLADGTPDADLIWNAFAGHGIACAAAAPPVFTTCVPPAVPALTATPGAGQVDLSWTAVAGATSYKIYRNEIGCGSGYTPIADVMAPTTIYTDTSVANGVTYYYRVQTVGSSDTCLSGFSTCQTATPVAPLIPANIYMVLDQSGSMSGSTSAAGEKKIDALHDAGQMVVDLVDDYATDGFRLGAVSFSTTVTGNSGLKDLSIAAEKTSLQTFINGLVPTNLTAIGLGINGAISALPPGSPNQKVVMLLSDGIQNVAPNLDLKAPPPGAAVGGVALPSDVQFYTVALGSNIQDDLFDDLATAGGIPGFYYSGGTPEIQSNFAFWIAGVLGLDPAGPFAPGGSAFAPVAQSSPGGETHYHVNKTARRVTFLVNWPDKGNNLQFELQTPVGLIHPPATSFHPAQGYAEYTVQFPLRGHGPSDHVGEWVVNITNNPQQLPSHTYALFDDPVLNLQYKTGSDDPAAGQPLPLEARVFENGAPISGLTVQATLDGPGQGVGEALSASNVSPASPAGDPGSAAERKLATLLRLDPDVLGHSASSITLIESEPGVYRAELPASRTLAAGTYVVNFSVAGHGVANGKFERSQRFSRYLRLKPEIGNSNVTVNSSAGVFHVTFTPRDRNNLRLGPGWENVIKVTASAGRVGRLVDNLDGSYSTTIEGTKSEPRITITVRGETIAR
jgi:von Willebrand factor type A domain-containing protein